MQQVVQRGRRLFAVPKPLDRAERIAARTNCRGNWNAIDAGSRNVRARVIVNQKG